MSETFEITLTVDQISNARMTKWLPGSVMDVVVKAAPQVLTLEEEMVDAWINYRGINYVALPRERQAMRHVIASLDLIRRPNVDDKMAEWLENSLASYPAAELKEWLAREVFNR